MDSDDVGKLLLFFAGVAFVCGCLITCSFKNEMYRGEAVKHGCGEFAVIDSTRGKTEFRWKGAR